MRRVLPLLAVLLGAGALAFPARAQTDESPSPDPTSTIRFALGGDARSLGITIQNSGLALAFAEASADSTPTAGGTGSGQCQVDGEDQECEPAVTEESKFPGEEGNDQPTCAAPQPPEEPLGTIISVVEGCGFSRSSGIDGVALTENRGSAGPAALALDLSGLSDDLENQKDALVDQIRDVIGELPENPARDLIDLLLASLQDGQLAQIELGPATSDVVSAEGLVTNVSESQGALINLFEIVPLKQPGRRESSGAGRRGPEAQGNGPEYLISLEIGASRALAGVNPDTAEVTGDADGSTATLRVLDPSTGDYIEEELDPDQTIELFGDTPIQTTITLGNKAVITDDEEGCVQASGEGARVQLGQGEEFEGGIDLRIASSGAAACAAEDILQLSPSVSPTTQEPLPATGNDSPVGVAIGLIVVAAVVLYARHRLAR